VSNAKLAHLLAEWRHQAERPLPDVVGSDPPRSHRTAPRHAPTLDSHTPRFARWKAFPRLRLDSRFVELCRRIWQEIDSDNCAGWAAQMSFYFVAALFPFFIFLAALVGFLPFSGFWHAFVAWTTHYLPRAARRFVMSEVLGLTQGRVSFLSIGVLGTAWTASSGITSLIESLNVAYEVRETRSYWERRGLALLTLFILSLLMFAAFGLLTAGHGVGVWLGAHAQSFYPNALWDLGRWLVSLGLIGMAAAIADYVLPNRKRPWRWVTPGSIFAILASVVASIGFNLYVEYVNSYSKTYGALGVLIILMFWIYIMSLIILIGAEVNCELERPKSAVQPPGSPSGPLSPNRSFARSGIKAS
jgi:membrane protein